MGVLLASSNRTLCGLPSLSHDSPKKAQFLPPCCSKYFCLSHLGDFVGCGLSCDVSKSLICCVALLAVSTAAFYSALMGKQTLPAYRVDLTYRVIPAEQDKSTQLPCNRGEVGNDAYECLCILTVLPEPSSVSALCWQIHRRLAVLVPLLRV